MSVLEVDPVALRRGGANLSTLADELRGDLAAIHRARGPDELVNAGWAATAAADAVAAAADAAFRALCVRARDLDGNLRAAADGYEVADHSVADRLRW
jgi:hypothetical protein